MYFTKSILASSIMLAISGTALAADWEAPKLEFNGSNQTEMESAYTKFVYNREGRPSGLAELASDCTGYITSPDLTDGGSVNYGGAPVFLQTGEQQKRVTNKGKIWVVGAEQGAVVAEAMGTTGTAGELLNEGTIYLDGKNNAQANSRIKGMSVINGVAHNDGDIVVKGNAVAMIDNSAQGSEWSKKLLNSGTITIIDSGVGISYRKESTNTLVQNTGTILVNGKNSVGILVYNDDKGEAGKNKKVINGGVISASEGSYAIVDLSENTSFTFTEKSNVDGLIQVNETTTLTYENNTDVLTLADKVGTVNSTIGSNLSIELGTESGLSIGEVKTDATSEIDFHLDRTGTSDSPVLEIGSVVEGSNVKYGYTGSVNDDVLAGSVSQENLFKGIQIGEDAESPDKVYAEEGEWAAATVYNADGTKQVLGENSLLSSATDLAITNALMWRSQLSNLTDRMGTLRTMPETAGAWARYNGGRFDGRGIQHDYNTVEVGFDKAISNNVMLGISFDYTKGDTDLDAGTSDNNTYTLGLYGSYFNESGCFLDAMLKVGRIDTDYDLNNGISEKGDYMLTGTIVGIETGHRWNIQNYFIEPQVQLTYSYLRPENYNTNLREVKFDDMKSLIARVGIMGGMKFAEDRGSAYVKASYNHDFLGDIEGNYSGVTAAGNAVRVNVDDELDDNWGEVSLGASYQVTDSVNTFVDVGTGFGGDIDQKWRVNLGARYVF